VQPRGTTGSAGDTGKPKLAEALAQTARTLALGGGVGLDFSALASGQVLPALHAFERAAQACTGGHNGSCEADASRCRDAGPELQPHRSPAREGARPGALMGVLHVDHPDLGAFIDAKAAGGLTHFNLSVGLTDAFRRQVEAGDPGASARWQRLVHAAWHHGEPGVLFLDFLDRDDNLAWRETVRATNPCVDPAGPGARILPLLRCRQAPGTPGLCLTPARGLAASHRPARAAQLPPAVGGPGRQHQPGHGRQRGQRDRAGMGLADRAPRAPWRRGDRSAVFREPCLAPVPGSGCPPCRPSAFSRRPGRQRHRLPAPGLSDRR
jgi:hypothetical protein